MGDPHIERLVAQIDQAEHARKLAEVMGGVPLRAAQKEMDDLLDALFGSSPVLRAARIEWLNDEIAALSDTGAGVNAGRIGELQARIATLRAQAMAERDSTPSGTEPSTA